MNKLREQIAEIDIEFEESKWQPTPDAKVYYIDFDIVRKGMDKIMGLLDGYEQKLKELAESRPIVYSHTGYLGDDKDKIRWFHELNKQAIDLQSWVEQFEKFAKLMEKEREK